MIEFFKYLTDKDLVIGQALTDKVNVSMFKPQVTRSGVKRMGINWKASDTTTFNILRDLAKGNVLLTMNGVPVRLAFNEQGKEFASKSRDQYGHEQKVSHIRKQNAFTLLTFSTVDKDEATNLWNTL